jgi:hypothetical protein
MARPSSCTNRTCTGQADAEAPCDAGDRFLDPAVDAGERTGRRAGDGAGRVAATVALGPLEVGGEEVSDETR